MRALRGPSCGCSSFQSTIWGYFALGYTSPCVCVWLVRLIPLFACHCVFHQHSAFWYLCVLVQVCLHPQAPSWLLAWPERAHLLSLQQSTLLQCPHPHARRRRAFFFFFSHSRHAPLQQIRGIFIFLLRLVLVPFAVGTGAFCGWY